MGKTIEYILESPISYQFDGSTTEGEIICLSAPSIKHRKKIAKLKQGFMRAIAGMPDNKNNKSPKEGDISDKEKGTAMLGLLQMSESIAYEDYLDIFVELLSDGVAKIDDKVVMTKSLLDKLSFDAVEDLLGEYLVNFIVGGNI